jgi:predicted Rossmann-fold nucleotide-binding protein
VVDGTGSNAVRADTVAAMPTSVVATRAELDAIWPDLHEVALVGIDLRDAALDWSAAQLGATMFMGCALPDGASARLEASGAVVLSPFDRLPFQPYRAELYTYDELMLGHDSGARATLDARIGAWFKESSTALHDAVARAIHDATIDAAVARYVVGRRVVGVMGGHALARDREQYRQVAELGRTLTRAGYTIATGGGPGVMEAANLGAWLAPATDADLDAALATLATAPGPTDLDAYVQAALDVRTRWPDGGESLGVPTWVYIDEPTTGFATHIAKYFTNSIREDGLLAVSRSGVVYAPGGAGTEQEIFTDTAQNSLTLYEVRSPIVFFGREFFETEHPELLAAARHQADAFGWSDLIDVCDTPDAIAAFIAAHDPDASGRAGIERRRAHQDG